MEEEDRLLAINPEPETIADIQPRAYEEIRDRSDEIDLFIGQAHTATLNVVRNAQEVEDETSPVEDHVNIAAESPDSNNIDGETDNNHEDLELDVDSVVDELTAPPPVFTYPPHFALTAKTGTEMTKCLLFRYRSTWKTFSFPTFQLFHESDSRVLLFARRHSLWTYDYDIFELQHGDSGMFFERGGPMHVATVKIHSYLFTGCSLYKGDGRSKEELAAFSEYAHYLETNSGEVGGIKKWKVLLPPLDKVTRQTHAVKPSDHGHKSLYQLFIQVNSKCIYPPEDYHFFRSQLPKKQDNNVYIMNFGDRQGRAKASAKNFKLIFDDAVSTVACQVVKIENDVFAVDFRPPFTASQAMAMAISQFHAEL